MAYGAVLGQTPTAQNIPYSGTAQGSTVKEGLDGLQSSVSELSSDVNELSSNTTTSIEEINQSIQNINSEISNISSSVYEFINVGNPSRPSVSVKASNNFKCALMTIAIPYAPLEPDIETFLVIPSSNSAYTSTHNSSIYVFSISSTNNTITFNTTYGIYPSQMKIVFFY